MSSSSLDISSILQALTGSSSTGLNVSALVTAAATAARTPETNWKTQQATLTAESSLLGQVNSLSSTLYDDIQKLATPDGVMTSLSASSSDYSVASVSVSSGAVTGTHTINVGNLAVAGSMSSGAYASSTTALPSGSFTINGAGGKTATVTIGSGVNTLDDVAKYINGQNIGVNASVVTDAQGARLALVAATSGVANDFTISNNTTSMTFSQGAGAKDASLSIDGISITSSTNTITGALSGVTLNLAKAGSATVTVETNTSSITSAINSFVSDYNSLITGINGQFKFNASTGSSGLLATNAATRSLQSSLLNSVTYSTSDANAGNIKSLSALGISMKDDGTLTVDSTKLQNALKNNASQVQNFFQGSASNGFANKLANTLDMYTDTSNGAFTVDINNNKQQISDLQSQIDEREAYVSEQMPIWQAKYAQAASELLSLPSKLKQIDAMLGNDKND